MEAAARRLLAQTNVPDDFKKLLVVSCFVPASFREELDHKYPITFLDRFDLTILAAKSASLLDELSTFLEADLQSIPDRISPLEHLQHIVAISKTPDKDVIGDHISHWMQFKDQTGTDLCNELKAISPGKSAWKKYESHSQKIIKYLFSNDLEGWHSQQRTDDGLNRFDYVCRIRATTEFWKFLIAHLDSRYILFEFKNYSDPVSQGQILTTEKYLYQRGLRRVAIILSRRGLDSNALAMAQGAMREHGKLMLAVDDEKICEMLHMKERGEDPSDCLFDLADNFLLSLPR